MKEKNVNLVVLKQFDMVLIQHLNMIFLKTVQPVQMQFLETHCLELKKCYVSPTSCEHPGEFNPTALQTSSNQITSKINELKDIELQMRSKIKQLLGYRDKWATDFSNQEQCLFSRLNKLDSTRDVLVNNEIANSNNAEGKYENLRFQIDQYLTQYILWGGITVLSGIALYVVTRNKGSANNPASARPKFNLNIGQR